MKKISFLFCLCLLLQQLQASAQPAPQPPLELSARQTSSLLFPYPILSVDRGSGDILAQIPSETANVLQLKGARENFPVTNLTVITSDGQLYCFPVRYASTPATAVLSVTPHAGQHAAVLLPGSQLTEAQFDNIALQLASDVRFYRGIRDKKQGAKAILAGVYTKGNTLIYRLVLHNASSLPYELEAVRMATRDRQQARRTATQEVELLPRYAWGTKDAVAVAGSSKVFLFALEHFPLGPGKEQVIELYERNGARHLTLRVHDRDLRLATPLLFE